MKKVLLDTHILVTRESDRTIGRHLREVLQYAAGLGYELVVHPRSKKEINNDKNIPDSKKMVLLSKVDTYPPLDSVSNPLDDEDFLRLIQGLDPHNFRDVSDAFLLYSLYKKEVDLLLTEDSELVHKARLLGISGRIMDLKHAAMNFKGKRRDDVPVFHFYKEGDMWFIGEEGKRILSYKHLDGFGHIHFLLRHPDQNLSPLAVYHRGKKSGDSGLDRELSIEEMDVLGLHGEGGINILKKRDIHKNETLIKIAIADLRKKRETSSYEEAMDLIEKIDQLETMLNQTSIRDHKSPMEKARVNLTKTIKTALTKIGNDNPISKHLKLTIKTGDEFSYLRLADDPKWKLHPDSK